MKQIKPQTKKLSLNRTTLRHLRETELAMVAGGGESARESACCSSPTKPQLEHD